MHFLSKFRLLGFCQAAVFNSISHVKFASSSFSSWQSYHHHFTFVGCNFSSTVDSTDDVLPVETEDPGGNEVLSAAQKSFLDENVFEGTGKSSPIPWKNEIRFSLRDSKFHVYDQSSVQIQLTKRILPRERALNYEQKLRVPCFQVGDVLSAFCTASLDKNKLSVDYGWYRSTSGSDKDEVLVGKGFLHIVTDEDSNSFLKVRARVRGRRSSSFIAESPKLFILDHNIFYDAIQVMPRVFFPEAKLFSPGKNAAFADALDKLFNNVESTAGDFLLLLQPIISTFICKPATWFEYNRTHLENVLKDLPTVCENGFAADELENSDYHYFWMEGIRSLRIFELGSSEISTFSAMLLFVIFENLHKIRFRYRLAVFNKLDLDNSIENRAYMVLWLLKIIHDKSKHNVADGIKFDWLTYPDPWRNEKVLFSAVDPVVLFLQALINASGAFGDFWMYNFAIKLRSRWFSYATVPTTHDELRLLLTDLECCTVDYNNILIKNSKYKPRNSYIPSSLELFDISCSRSAGVVWKNELSEIFRKELMHFSKTEDFKKFLLVALLNAAKSRSKLWLKEIAHLPQTEPLQLSGYSNIIIKTEDSSSSSTTT